MLPCELRLSETFYGSGELFLFTFFPSFKVHSLHRCISHIVTYFHFAQLFAVAATLKYIDYNVAMTFILNTNNNNTKKLHAKPYVQSCISQSPKTAKTKMFIIYVHEM